MLLKVSEITNNIKLLLEENFSEISVVGELSNFKAHVSGHWYFTLKDSNAQISCTMWRGINKYVFFTPQDGLKVIVSGKISVYPPRGNYQIDVRSIKAAGEGELQAAFEKLKKKLSAEGLFDEEIKKRIPRFPAKIGIATAIDGAAFKDMLSVVSRRYPLTEIVIAPCRVQGAGAAEEIAASIKLLNETDGIDVIIIGRGGGSLEDLWAFNEEVVARAVFESNLPVISGVGHEIDFTISDFVSDLRAPTPSAAMELATPNIDDLIAFISDFSYNSSNQMFEIISEKYNLVENISNSYGFRKPEEIIKSGSQQLDNLLYRIQNKTVNLLGSKRSQLDLLKSVIKSFDTNKILERGFALIKQNDKIVKKSVDLKKDLPIKIKFSDNEIEIN
ncbi:MAG: exodeoxyribonuclease VII large subunit [Ignavibacteriae bacterium]|nr:exodeoxyribonuclease VII large subunit [Ignavibacteriota bacterium]NOG96726.1 exodeoxyribonuclease VII large subunit [Ignavibacteriota bacterium]